MLFAADWQKKKKKLPHTQIIFQSLSSLTSVKRISSHAAGPASPSAEAGKGNPFPGELHSLSFTPTMCIQAPKPFPQCRCHPAG